jgi:hypothetical protein
MKILAILTLAAAAALPAHAGTNIGVSIGINAPGQYGRIDINNYPQPVLVMPQPVIYAPAPQAAYQRAVYLYVPPAHRANWGRYCGGYRACGQPVYFVQENWVRDEYRREHEHRRANPPKRHDDHHGRADDRGHKGEKGNGHGNGKGHGK